MSGDFCPDWGLASFSENLNHRCVPPSLWYGLAQEKTIWKKTGRGLSSWLKSLQSGQADHMSNQSTLTGNCRSITVLIFYSWRPHCPMVCTREHLLLIFGFCVWYPSFKKVLKRSWSIFQDSCIFPALWKDCPALEPVVILRKLIVSFPAAAVGDRRAGKSQLIVRAFSSHRRCCARVSQNIFSNTTFTFLAIVDCLFFSLLLSPWTQYSTRNALKVSTDCTCV